MSTQLTSHMSPCRSHLGHNGPHWHSLSGLAQIPPLSGRMVEGSLPSGVGGVGLVSSRTGCKAGRLERRPQTSWGGHPQIGLEPRGGPAPLADLGPGTWYLKRPPA